MAWSSGPLSAFTTRASRTKPPNMRVSMAKLEFHKVVFRKVYADGQDISKWDVLRSAAAEEVGLDADDMQTVVDGGKYTAQVAEQVRWAQQIGVSGVPTYVINDRYAIVGAQPYEAFKNALAQIMKASS
jgi:predicted DsbA family dithiol-disulfide isomerase